MKRFLQKGSRSLWFFGFVVVLLWAIWPLFRPFAFLAQDLLYWLFLMGIKDWIWLWIDKENPRSQFC